MLVIHQHQIDALHEARMAAFLEGLRALLRDRLPALAAAPVPALDAEIRRICDAARRFYITSERDVARFVELVLARWGAFPSEGLPRPALGILTAYGADPQAKLDRFEIWLGEVANNG